MSVKISRREEKRDNSIREFMLAALLPLLLSGLVGYFIGETGRIDSRVSRTELGAIRDSLNLTTAQLAERDWLVGELDSLLEAFIDSRKRRLEEFAALEVAGTDDSHFDDPLTNWIRATASDFTRFSGAVSQLEGSLDGKAVIAKNSLHPLFELFREVNLQSNLYFRLRSSAYLAQTAEQRVMTETLTDSQSDCEDEIAGVNAELALTKSKLESKMGVLEIMETRLAMANSTASNEQVTYQPQKGEINAAIIEIEAITQQIPSGVLVPRRKKEEIEARIMKEIGKIENALAIIE